ncbi:Uncharacterised protein [Klebsiella pneumoniae]|nr:Uncharacterised protein [Klebsiella pneumoniae]
MHKSIQTWASPRRATPDLIKRARIVAKSRREIVGIRAKAGARVSGSESSFTSPTRRRREVKKRSGAVYRKGDHFADAFSAQRQHDHAVNAQRHAGAVGRTRSSAASRLLSMGLLRKAARGAFAVIPAQTAGAVHGRRSARGNRSPAQYLCNRPQSAQRPDDLPG